MFAQALLQEATHEYPYRVAHPLLVPLYYGCRWLGNLRVLLGYVVGRLEGVGPHDGNVR